MKSVDITVIMRPNLGQIAKQVMAVENLRAELQRKLIKSGTKGAAENYQKLLLPIRICKK
jgi:hypothetical protein